MKRYCTICNAELEMANIGGIKRLMCVPCDRLESGYTEDEMNLVCDLQKYFRINERWKIKELLHIFRKYKAAP